MLNRFVTIFASLQFLAPIYGAERTLVASCDYADDAAARAVWTPVEGSLPVEAMAEPLAGRTGVRMPCDMTGDRRRAAWDLSVDLELTRADRFSFWVYVDNPSKMAGHYSLYFGSGEGWYGATFSVEKGWKQIVLDKSAFGVEGAPTGWRRIQRIRVSSWKSQDAVTFMAFSDLESFQSPIVVIVGDLTFRVNEREAAGVKSQAQRMSELLKSLDIEAGAIGDTDVESGALEGRKMALFAYSPNMSDREAVAVEQFVNAGGKVMAFYSAHPRFFSALGLQATKWVAREYEGQFASIHLDTTGFTGMPPSVQQNSWNINGVRPAGENARILGEWFNAKGEATGLPALAVSDTGAFMTHILLSEDSAGKQQMMLSLLGHFLPEVWPGATERALTSNEKVGHFTSLESVTAFIRESGVAAAAQHLYDAERLMREAKQAADTKRYPEAIAAARKGREALVAAYCAAQKSRSNELRAVWCHSAFGVTGMTWDEAVKALADGGFNAVVPNSLWAGRAWYRSSLLPVDESLAVKGDQIAECVAAGQKHGVQVYVWKVNWNLSNAPKEFLQRMRSEGRTQKDPKGGDIDWLCPSHPANFELERDSMLEVARNYAVDGLHFDYIRYPGSNGCYCDGCRERFQQQLGVTVADWPRDVIDGSLKPKYLEFRCDNITRLVKAVSEEAHRLKPGIKISAAVFSNWPGCRDGAGQDWVGWIEKGYLDFVCPMNYTNSAPTFETMISSQLEATQHRIPFVPGIGVTLGSWTLAADEVAWQINLARQHQCDGFILFNYSPHVVTDVLPGLRAGVTSRN